ncbi:unnamed protein product (macronuclear) [Paramecium tetraurelia]|uniref:Uncharacterized protein n=1 Tax=Paramecium tetraurelia TaxID=5888 RepID=A0CPK4_PARTE|nr:uncharacterized protein GSPATT00009113001 [Paramecium tetraurelia]CAK72721.1 unnamed protein product [Paramecium tetraurelia]|eukprot:XP_001440118.1 hypothetical protein (macronuclear) [Paramecium tetraurelia strain d4-2]
MSSLSFVSYEELIGIFQFQNTHIQFQKEYTKEWQESEIVKFKRFMRRNKKIKKDKVFFQYQSQFIQTKSYQQCRKFLRDYIRKVLDKHRYEVLKNHEILYCFGPLHPNFEVVETENRIKMRRIKEQSIDQNNKDEDKASITTSQ